MSDPDKNRCGVCDDWLNEVGHCESCCTVKDCDECNDNTEYDAVNLTEEINSLNEKES